MLLLIKDLSVEFQNQKVSEHIIKKVSLELEQGEILGIVGESGSGKSMTSLAISRLLPKKAIVTEGNIYFDNRDLLTYTEQEMQKLRGKEIGMIFQEPMTSLNPLKRIGEQIEESLILHHKKEKKEDRKKEVLAMLHDVEFSQPEEIYGKYPHQLSGGMRQRVMIAIAMILKPKLLIADEPTTALDVTVQSQILKLIQKMNKEYHTSVILISHDLGVIKNICSKALVMKEGQVIEAGLVNDLFYHPQKEYTKKLVEAIPKIEKREDIAFLKENKSLIKVENLKVFYKEKKRVKKQVVKGVSFCIKQGEILGIVGESGCGKTTLAKAVAGLTKSKEGKISLSDTKPQMVFQDPYSSLNPSKKVGWILEEPLKVNRSCPKEERRKKVNEILEQVGLEEKYADRYISELSGGQRQRVSIAAALINNQKVIILDEPVSALDVTIQDQILKLLKRLREKYNLSYLFISHDLNVIYQMCDRVGVMKDGEIIEMNTIGQIYYNPQKEYTKQLLAAIPKL